MTTLVLLPGMDGTGTLFSGFISELRGAVRPVVLSYPPEQPLGYDELTALIRAQLPETGPYVLLGESFGGPLAIALAASRPPGLVGVVLCCTFATNPVRWMALWRSAIGWLAPAKGLIDLAAPLLFGSYSSRALRSALRNAVGQVSFPVLHRRLEAVLAVDVRERARQIDVPVLYLQATHDRLVPATAGRQLQSVIAQMQMAPIDGPHLLLQAAPERAAEAIDAFVATLTGPCGMLQAP